MILILCVDKNGGMLFNERRVSSDIKVVEDIMRIIGRKKLYINQFSKDLFENEKRVKVVNIEKKRFWKNDYCFVENLNPKKFENMIHKIIIYNWNREYPSDFKCEIDSNVWNLKSERTIVGNSHEEISVYEYERG